MGKIVNLETAKTVGLNFLDSRKRKDQEVTEKLLLKQPVKERQLELIHQGASLTPFAGRDKTRKKAQLLELKKEEEPCFYIFNSDDNGFVIVSADESYPPILGYSLEGSIDETDLPPSMVAYMESLRQAILHTRKNKMSPTKKTTEKWEKFKKNKSKEPDLTENDGETGSSDSDRDSGSVEPLIKTKWGQGEPYNKFCPPGCPTGCVATAMAQVMRYHKFPRIGVGSHTSNGVTANFGATIYRGYLMPEKLTNSSSIEEIDAVATLMRHCGISVDMNYTPGSSGAVTADVKDALKNYFKYDSSINIKNDHPNDSAWTNLLKTELNNKRPVIYRGGSSVGGHAFVCDGYDNEGLFHFNWGWNGSSDGNFTLTDLLGFTIDNYFIYNIKPDERFLYYVSERIDTNGEHEVHRFNCTHKPKKTGLILLRDFANAKEAVQAAEMIFNKADGCYFCCHEAHTM